MKFKALPVTSLEDATVDLEQLQANGVDRINGTTVPLTGAAWTAPTLVNSWVVFAGLAVGYLKDPLGIVRLRGAVSTGTSGTTVFTLPAGFRPGQLAPYPSTAIAATISDVSGVSISTAGVVTAYIAGGGNATFDGITFLAEN